MDFFLQNADFLGYRYGEFGKQRIESTVKVS